jgi:DnaJ-class molecular chaperone
VIQRWDLVKRVGKSGPKFVMDVHLRSSREQQKKKAKRRVICMMLTCSMCDGLGKIPAEVTWEPVICPDCDGAGKVESISKEKGMIIDVRV